MKVIYALTIWALLCTGAMAADCSSDVRAQMLMVDWPEPMRQNITTSFGGNEIKGTALSTGANRAMYMDKNGMPQSLSLDERFYSTSDGGKTWDLVRTYTPEEMKQRIDDLAKQAEIATDADCEYGIELGGRRVNRLIAKTVLQSGGQDYAVTYFVDTETGFPWRVETEFYGVTITRITQDNEPAAGESLPDLR